MGEVRTNPAIGDSGGLRKVLDSSEASEYLGISYWLIRKLVKEKKIPHYKIESKTFFTKEILDRYIQDHLEREKKSSGFIYNPQKKNN